MTKTPIAIRGGRFTLDPRMDRVPEVDLRNLNYPLHEILPQEALKGPRSFTWYVDERLDQGYEGACVSTGWGHELAARPAEVENINFPWCRETLYFPGQMEDEWEGGAYPGANPFMEGTSVTAVAKIVKRLGFIDQFRWALNPRHFISGLGHHGPAVIGVDWKEGMENTDEDGFITFSGDLLGGHCVCVVSVKIYLLDKNRKATWDNVDWLRSYIVILNSWGEAWGVDGKANMRLVDVLEMWPGGDFCFAVGRHKSGRTT